MSVRLTPSMRFTPSMIVPTAVLAAAVLSASLLGTSCSDGSDEGATASVVESSASTAATSDSATSTPGSDASAPASTAPNGTASTQSEAGADDLYPDVVGVTAEQDANGTWTVSVTLSSPYDSAERYADAWRILAPDGTELGIRELGHDHANEQPFTRNLADVDIPDEVDQIIVEGRDQVNGWGGATYFLTLDR